MTITTISPQNKTQKGLYKEAKTHMLCIISLIKSNGNVKNIRQI
jgi:hypothetical protein